MGTYNHAAMLDYHAGRLLLTWKCSPENEDQAGQRVLYSQSDDGSHWTPVLAADHGDSSTMFPNMVRAPHRCLPARVCVCMPVLWHPCVCASQCV